MAEGYFILYIRTRVREAFKLFGSINICCALDAGSAPSALKTCKCRGRFPAFLNWRGISRWKCPSNKGENNNQNIPKHFKKHWTGKYGLISFREKENLWCLDISVKCTEVGKCGVTFGAYSKRRTLLSELSRHFPSTVLADVVCQHSNVNHLSTAVISITRRLGVCIPPG